MMAGFKYEPATGLLYKKPVGPVKNRAEGNPTHIPGDYDSVHSLDNQSPASANTAVPIVLVTFLAKEGVS